ncbi:sucrose phosphorylase [Streptococcus sp. 10F2]
MPKNKVQLMTYPDSLGGNLKELKTNLDLYFPDVFQGGIHILPPYPSSGDRGFAPLTYFEIDPKFGDWSDMQALAEDYDLLLDLMVNHISQKSHYFQDFLEKGRESDYADYFLTLEKIWKDGNPVQEDIDKMFLRREVPYSEFIIEKTGELERVWTTFGKTTPSEQIDFDIYSAKVRQLFKDIFEHFSNNGIRMIRLDAVGYVIKKIGTSSFFVEPDIYEFLDWIMELATSYNIELLPEVHSHYSIQYSLSKHGFWIYDFILPYRIFEALSDETNVHLAHYLKTRPHRQFTMLDCHDGLPVKPDLDGLIDSKEARRLTDLAASRGANMSLIVSDEHKEADGFDVHQIRSTIYSLFEEDAATYLLARGLQLFTPGIPQIYYVGLLAGKNDLEMFEKTGDGREINRHNYSQAEIAEAVQTDVVKGLVELIRFRNEHPAFSGDFTVETEGEEIILLKWTLGEEYCQLRANLKTKSGQIVYSNDGEVGEYLL